MRPGQVYLQSPDGKERMFVPAADAQGYIAKGATRVSRWLTPAPGSYSEMPYMPQENLPAVLGAVAPLAIPGVGEAQGLGWLARTGMSALGGGGGRMLTNAQQGAPLQQGVGTDAVNQGKQQLAGEALGIASSMGGRGVVAGSLASRGRQLTQGTGEMVRGRLPVGGVNVPGAAWAAAKGGFQPQDVPIVGPSLVRGSTAASRNFGAATAARDAANAAGPNIPAQPLDNEFGQMAQDFAGRSDKSTQMSALLRRYNDFVDTWRAGQLSAADAQKYLTSLNDEATPLWQAKGQRGVTIPPADQVVAQQAKRLSGVLKQTMGTLVKGHTATNAALSSAIAAKDAIAASESMPGIGRMLARSGVGSTIGGAIGGATSPGDRLGGIERGSALGFAAANMPQVTSRAGLLMTDPVLQQFLRQTPRFILSQQQGQ